LVFEDCIAFFICIPYFGEECLERSKDMGDCLFCKIVNNEIPATKIHEDEHTIAFKDIQPQAPVHILVIPKEHVAAVHEYPPGKFDVLIKVFETVTAIVKKNGLVEKGYRLVINSGEKAGQSVPHLHVHILSGRDMHWPPG
jgi:histidine triad (HIT) family protein